MFTAHIQVTGKSSSSSCNYLISPPVNKEAAFNGIPIVPDLVETSRVKKRKFPHNTYNVAGTCKSTDIAADIPSISTSFLKGILPQ